MIRQGPDVPRATTSRNIRKDHTPISRVPSFVEACGIVLLVVGLAFFPRVARASQAEPRTVVIMAETHTEAVSQRLRQEIEALGFQVEVQPETAPLRSLEAIAEEAGAMAVIRVKSLLAGGVEMTVLDRVTGKTVHRELARASESNPADRELVATRTVELFRASLMELSADHPTRGAVTASPPVQALVQRDQQPRRHPLARCRARAVAHAGVAAFGAALDRGILAISLRVRRERGGVRHAVCGSRGWRGGGNGLDDRDLSFGCILGRAPGVLRFLRPF